MKAFILAGGFATRLWPLTEKRAKPLLPLAGKPLLTHLVEKIPEGIPITVSTNAIFAEDFEKWKKTRHAERSESASGGRTQSKHVATEKIVALRGPSTPSAAADSAQDDVDQRPLPNNITILIEDSGHEDEKLGALGAVAKWITDEKIDDDVLLLAGDNYVGFSIEELIKNYHRHPLLAVHDIKDKEKAKQFGTVITDRTTVKAFEEKPEDPKSTLISTGCYILPNVALPVLVDYAKEHPDNIGSIFAHFLTQNIKVECMSFTEPWFDIGSFEAYLEATRALVGETPSTEGNTFHGSVVLGKNSHVQKSTLTNVVLFDDCEVEDCVLENCIIDNGCTLKGVDLSGKMLREGTVLSR